MSDDLDTLEKIAEQFGDDVEKLNEKLDEISTIKKEVKTLRGKVDALNKDVVEIKTRSETYITEEKFSDEIEEKMSAFIPKAWFQWISAIIISLSTVIGIIITLIKYNS